MLLAFYSKTHNNFKLLKLQLENSIKKFSISLVHQFLIKQIRNQFGKCDKVNVPHLCKFYTLMITYFNINYVPFHVISYVFEKSIKFSFLLILL